MEIRTFRVPFAEIVGPEATEIAFGADDYVELRSLYGYPATEVSDIIRRMQVLTTPAEDADADAATAEAEAIVADILRRCVVGWNLNGPEGPIAKPMSNADVEQLPPALAGQLIRFLTGFRGRPDPTPAA